MRPNFHRRYGTFCAAINSYFHSNSIKLALMYKHKLIGVSFLSNKGRVLHETRYASQNCIFFRCSIFTHSKYPHIPVYNEEIATNFTCIHFAPPTWSAESLLCLLLTKLYKPCIENFVQLKKIKLPTFVLNIMLSPLQSVENQTLLSFLLLVNC